MCLKKANDASHVSLLKLPNGLITVDLVTQIAITLHSNSQITKLLSNTKRERHLFLFENYLVIAKKQEYESTDKSSKSQNQINDLGSPGCGDETFRYITKHVVKINNMRCSETVDNMKIVVQNLQTQEKFVVSVGMHQHNGLFEELKAVEEANKFGN